MKLVLDVKVRLDRRPVSFQLVEIALITLPAKLVILALQKQYVYQEALLELQGVV